LLAAVLLLPFAGKAFTIDDTVFMRQAEWVLTDPLHPSALTMVWSEVPRPMRLSQVMPTGPLMAWLLAPAAAAGGSEVVAHLVQILLLVVAVLEVAALALRLGFGDDVARLASLLLASTPAVLAMAGTVMPDVAAMSFALVGIERLLAWRDHGRPLDGTLAAAALGLAPLARSHVALLLGLALFFLGPPWRESAWKRWWPVVAAPLVTALLIFVTRDPLGGSGDMVQAAGMFSSLANVRSNAVAFGVHWVLLLPLGIAWMASRGRAYWLSVFPYAGIVIALAALWNQPRWLWIAPIAGLGVGAVADAVADCARSRDPNRIALGLWLLAALPIVIYLHFPSKYLVVSAPAAAILAAAAIVKLPSKAATGLGIGLVGAGALFGTLILQADADFAGLGRRAVDELIRPNTAAGRNVWFNANWGFQWYAERAGAKILTTTPPKPQAGDLVVTARETITAISIRNFRQRELVATVTDATPGGRIISSALGAGFYSNGWGYLPWAWGSTEIDRFELWRLR
jgi:4-amino-4-deoxy-L-arabinose transferase-like glycosyltransferase